MKHSTTAALKASLAATQAIAALPINRIETLAAAELCLELGRRAFRRLKEASELVQRVLAKEGLLPQ